MSNRDPLQLARRLGLAGALVLAGTLGVWPSAAQGADPVAALFWLSVLAPCAGALAAASGVLLLPLGWLVPVLWTLPVLWASHPARPLPSPLWSLLAWTGLFAAGSALGEAARRRGWNIRSAAALALVAAGALAVLPARAALDARPWPPSVARALLDLSPSALVIECAGVDWMRHAAVYDPAGTDRFARRPWPGELAGPAVLLVGCALAAAARRVPVRRTSTPAGRVPPR